MTLQLVSDARGRGFEPSLLHDSVDPPATGEVSERRCSCEQAAGCETKRDGGGHPRLHSRAAGSLGLTSACEDAAQLEGEECNSDGG